VSTAGQELSINSSDYLDTDSISFRSIQNTQTFHSLSDAEDDQENVMKCFLLIFSENIAPII
jgi:hypothetical protein